MKDFALALFIWGSLVFALVVTSGGFLGGSGTDAEQLIRLVGEVPNYSGCNVSSGGWEGDTQILIVTRCWAE